MKKIVLASIVILSAFFTSCAKSNLVVEPDGANTLSAVMENSDSDSSSRTTLGDRNSVIWSAGDKLSVFNQGDQSQQAEYTISQGAGTRLAVFQSDKSLGAGAKYAFYPASTEVTCAADEIRFNLPATQAYAKNSFANGSNPMVAKSNDKGELLFKNLCGVIKFQLTGTATVASVKMETAGQVVAGAMTVDMNYPHEPVMKVATTGSTSITLTKCNVQLSESVSSTFYFTVPAATYAKGLKFTAYDDAGKVIISKSTKSSLTVSRSRIASLLGVYLYFPDANFRAKLVADYHFVQTADGSDIDITNPANAEPLKTTKLDVSTTGSASRATTTAKITSLNGIEYFTELTELNCKGNSLKTLDVSKNTALTSLDCSGNQLKTLDIRSTKLADPAKLQCGSQTSDGSTSQDIYLSLTAEQKAAKLGGSQAKLQNFPDARFRAMLVANYNFVQTADGTDIDITNTANAALLKQTTMLSVGNDRNPDKISDLTGIEYFTALTELNCGDNLLTTLDVSKNTALIKLDCSYNQLTTLDVSKNTALAWLSCWNNQLTTLDVSKNTALIYIWCWSNSLTTLDVSKNTALIVLNCSDNQLTTLDVSKNTQLYELSCGNNLLTTLDVSGCTALTRLSCGNNQLTTLDVSKNTQLYELSCGNNLLTTLNASGCTVLTELRCSGNQLPTLDVSKNRKLTRLNCDDNQLTTLDVSQNTALTALWCSGNQLPTLDVSNNMRLYELKCYNNQLPTLDVSKNTQLRFLYCFGNRMSALDITKLSRLVAPYNLQCGEQKGSDGTGTQTLTLTLTQAQKTAGLGTGEHNTGVTPTVK